MIIVFHKNNKVTQVYDYSFSQELTIGANTIQEVLVLIASQNKSRFIGWCHDNLRESLNLATWKTILKHKLLLVSFETSTNYYITPDIGYVDDSPFMNVNKNVEYPTWFMSSDVGVTHAMVLLKFKSFLKYKLTFELFLNTIAKVGMKQGLLCYSNPLLLNKGYSTIRKKSAPTSEIIQFIKSNYKVRWIFLYVFNQFIYNNKFLGVHLFLSLFKKRISKKVSLETIHIHNKVENLVPTIDVLIPTLGREQYLKDVLVDLSKQTNLPKKVIIIEQNPVKSATSKLDFLFDKWPFEIDHSLIHQLGACNARNIGLSKVTADWVFFADDDIRLDNNVLENSFKYINLYGAKAVTISSLQKNEKEIKDKVTQYSVFGTCSSIVNAEFLKNIKFDMAYEFGYGEDSDFGMQLRNIGTDILYIPFVSMLHLKAPIGGFRKKIKQEWELETVQPKPSPTVMVYKLKHATLEQLQGYKTTLFFKFYKVQPIKNPFKYFKIMDKRWNKSLFWANHLIKKHSNEI